MFADIIVLAVLAISSVISFMRGFIRETLTILGVVGGSAASYFGGPLLNPSMRTWLGVEEGKDPGRLLDVIPYTLVADACSYGLIFIVVVVALSLLSHMLAESVKAIGLGSLDRTLGVFFGMARGIVLLGLLYLPFHLLLNAEQKQSYFKDSKTIVYLEQTAAAITNLLPDTAPDAATDAARQTAQQGSAAREALQKIDLLRQMGEQAQGLSPAQGEGQADGYGEAKPAPAAPAGYDEQFRQQMNEMFKEQETTPQRAPAPARP